MPELESITRMNHSLMALVADDTRTSELVGVLKMFHDNKGAALEGLSTFRETGEDLFGEMDQLYDRFMDGSAHANWREQAQDVIFRSYQMFMGDKFEAGGPADLFAQEYMSRYKTAVAEVEADLHLSDISNPSMMSMEGDIKRATTYGEFQSIIQSFRKAAQTVEGYSVEAAEEYLDKAEEMLAASRATSARDGEYTSMLSEGDMHIMRDYLKEACVLYDRDKKLDHSVFSIAYSQERKTGSAIMSKEAQAGLREKEQAQHMQEILPQIRDMQVKMQEGDAWWHRNSDEYKRMKKAVDKVCELGQDYDPHDRDKVVEMQKAMDELHDASLQYAKKEAYGKTKSTEMGVSRKNSAIFLSELTEDKRNPGKEGIDLSQIQDWRMSKKDPKTPKEKEVLENGIPVDQTPKRKVKLGALMEAEKAANADRHEKVDQERREKEWQKGERALRKAMKKGEIVQL